jgi:hypothetical protein
VLALSIRAKIDLFGNNAARSSTSRDYNSNHDPWRDFLVETLLLWMIISISSFFGITMELYPFGHYHS